MAGRPPQKPLEEDKLACSGIIRSILPLRDKYLPLPDDPHGNTRLFLRDVLIVLLAAFYNPACRSQRLIEQLSGLDWAQKGMGTPLTRRSTLSDAFARFNPDELLPIIKGLMQQIPALHKIENGDLEEVGRQILAADGSYWNIPADIAWAFATINQSGKPGSSTVRLNFQLEIIQGLPVEVSLSGMGDGGEAAALQKKLKRNVIYVLDRGYMDHRLILAILKNKNNLVLRLREDRQFEAEQSLALGQADRDAGIILDEIGRLPTPHSVDAPDIKQTMRRVVIVEKESGRKIVLLTDILKLSAERVGHIYRQRWQIELFFRWLKVWANFDHLFSHRREGILLQFYVAVIGCLLMHMATRRKPNRYMMFLMSHVASGSATLEEIQPMLDKIQREKDLEKARLARKKAMKNSAQ